MAACGLAAGMALNTTVAPFILRGVTLGRQTSLLSEKPPERIVLDMVNSSLPDPYVFGLLGSAFGSVSHKFGSGSGSFPFPIKALSGVK